jgi:hypothetical protein
MGYAIWVSNPFRKQEFFFSLKRPDRLCSVVTGVLSTGVRGLEHEVHHSTPFSTKIKNEYRHISAPHILHHGVESHFTLVIAYKKIFF